MTYFLDSVCTIVGIFHKYAQRQGQSLTLNRREMKMLIETEFAAVLENPCDPQTVEFTFQLLDVNGDSLVDFNEYLIFIFQIAKACYSYLQPREYLLQEDGSRALHEGEPGGSKRDHWQLQDEEREEDYVHERSDRTPLRPMDDSRRGELGSCYLPSEPEEEEKEEEEEEEHNFQGRDRELRNGDRRVHSSREQQKKETERRRLEPKQQEDIETPERHQLRQREPALEEGSPKAPHQSRRRRNDNDRRQADELLDGDEQDLYPPIVTSRRDDGRQRRGRETEQREAEGRLLRCGSKARVDQGNHRAEYDSERSRASCEPRELEDGRRDLETHDELRTRAFVPRVADERRDQIRNRRPVDDYEEHRPLPREGERRSQSHETEHRESERRRREHSAFQARDDVRRANRAEEEEVRGPERRRDEDEWSRPRRCEALRRPEVEELEHRERERRRPYSPELENMDRRSQPHDSEGRVRRSRHREDERRRQQFSWEETQATESRRRRPRSHEPEPRDPKYGRSQRYEEEPKRDDQRRQHNYEVQSPERDVARRRRLQTRESSEREDNQERQQYYEHESQDSEGDRRRPQLCYLEPREGEKRRHQLTDSRVDERERLQSRESVSRPAQHDRFSPSDSPGEYDWSRQQIYESRDIEQREGRRRSYDRRSCGQRQIQGIDIDQREGEGQRRMNTEAREVDQKQTQTRGVDHGESEQQRRTSSRDSGDKDIDQRRTQTDEASSRDGEDQRRTSSHDSNTRQVNQKMMQTSDPDFRDTEIPQHNKGNSPQPREVTSLSNQTGDREFAEGLLRDQRPPESGESQLSRKPRQHKAEQSRSIPHTLEQKQATRGSQCLSGPELRGPQRRWLQPHQTEAQEGEAGVEQTQLTVGSRESKRATSQPGEQQTTEGQESRIQRHHPKPATQDEGESELSLAGKGGKAQEPAAVKQRQLQAQGASYEGEGPQPEVEGPKVEEDDENGPRAQESQPPLEEDDQQAVTEKPCDSLGESKSSVVCNPLYEYLLAQKKQEQP